MQTKTEKIKIIEDVFGKGKLSRSGDNISVSCPVCKQSEKLKLSICLNTLRYHCWVCGKRGADVRLYISKISTYVFEDIKKDKKEIQEAIIVKLPENYTFFGDIWEQTPINYMPYKKYLQKRKVSLDTIWRFRIGICVSGEYANSIVFPSFDEKGDLNYYCTRSILPEGRKYKNCKNKKSEIIFNECDLNFKKELFLFEGPFDLINAPHNSVCLLGSSMSPRGQLFEKIVKNQTPVTICLDDDVREKSVKISQDLLNYGVRVKLANTSGYEDPGEMSKKEIERIINNACIWDEMSYFKHKIQNIRSGSII